MTPSDLQTVVLANGETLSGHLIPLSRAHFLLQAQKMSLKLSEDEIRSVDGNADLRHLLKQFPEDVGEESYFHEVHETGGGTDYVATAEIHKGPEPRMDQTFFFGKGDKPMSKEEKKDLGLVMESMEYRDRWGHALPLEVEEATEKGWKYRVRFYAPVFSGEPIHLVHKKIWPRWSRREDDGWVRGHYIRPSTKTLVSVAIRLPEGATFFQLDPPPLWQMRLNGRETVGWRRYIADDGTFMPKAKYRW